MVEPRRVRDLQTAEPAQPGRATHVAAASGIVVSGEQIYVVADDEVALARFELGGDGPGAWIRLCDDELPLGHTERKRAKPDLEALARLPDGTLLALGSGATPARERGWLVDPGDDSVRPVSLAPLYQGLRARIADLNIEGAAFAGDALWLAQRGNGADGENALLELSAECALAGLLGGTLAFDCLRGVHGVELGDVEGVPLTLSDLAPAGDGELVFCAIAEAGESTFFDGPCLGAAVGVVEIATGTVIRRDLLSEPLKIEGIALRDAGALLVADDDDAGTAAPLLAANWP